CGEPDGAVRRARARDCERGVVVRVRPVEAGERAGRGLVERDVEQETLAPFREEVLEWLLRDPVLAGGPHRRPECEERALQVAPRRFVALAGADVSADGSLRPDLDVRDVRGAR